MSNKHSIIVSLLLFFLLISFNAQKLEFTAEDGILVLNQTNFAKARRIPNLAVFFYNSNRESRKLLPVLYQLVDNLKDFKPKIYAGKVDAESELGVADNEKITKFPCLKIYTADGRELNYDGMNSIDSLVSYIKRKIKVPVGNSFYLSKFQDVENFVARNKAVTVFFGKLDTPEFKLFVSISEKNKGMFFGHSFNAEIRALNEYELDFDEIPQIIVFNMHKEKNLTYYGEWTEKKLFSFIKDHTSNFFIKLDKDKWNYLFNEKNNSFLLMLIADQSTHDVELEIFHLAARNVSSKLISTYYSISQNQEFSKYLYNFLPALESQIPLIFLIDRMKNETINILMKDEIVYDNIIKFTNNWWRNYFKEEDKSEDRQGFNELIDILNETNFKKKVNDNKKDFIVLFFSNKVKNIRDAKQKFNQYAIMFKNNKNLSFAVINIEENKIEGHKSESSEKIYFFGKKNKKKEILYENDLENEYKFISFVKKNTAYEWIEVETNTKAKDDL